MNKDKIVKYYQALCKELNINPVPIVFTRVARGGACIQHDTKGKIFNIQFDLSRCKDIEYAMYHELAHQILIVKNNNFTHNRTFKNLECKLNETYMYSKLSAILYN